MSPLMSKLFSDADCVVLDVTFQASVDLQYLMNVVTFNNDTLRCRYHITRTSHTCTCSLKWVLFSSPNINLHYINCTTTPLFMEVSSQCSACGCQSLPWQDNSRGFSNCSSWDVWSGEARPLHHHCVAAITGCCQSSRRDRFTCMTACTWVASVRASQPSWRLSTQMGTSHSPLVCQEPSSSKAAMTVATMP